MKGDENSSKLMDIDEDCENSLHKLCTCESSCGSNVVLKT